MNRILKLMKAMWKILKIKIKENLYKSLTTKKREKTRVVAQYSDYFF